MGARGTAQICIKTKRQRKTGVTSLTSKRPCGGYPILYPAKICCNLQMGGVPEKINIAFP